MSNEELAVLIQNGDQNLLPKLWEQVRRFVAMKAGEYISRSKEVCHPRYEVDDLISEGYIAVVDACRYFDPKSGSFLTILGYTLKTAFGRVSGTHSSQRRDAIHRSVSVDLIVSNDDSSETSLLEFIGAEDNALEEITESIYIKDLRAALDEALSTLPEKQRQVLRLFYYFNCSYEEQAKWNNTSRQRVSSLASDGLWRIRFNTAIMKKLSGFLEERNYDAYLYTKYIQSSNGDLSDDEAESLLI